MGLTWTKLVSHAVRCIHTRLKKAVTETSDHHKPMLNYTIPESTPRPTVYYITAGRVKGR